MSSRALTLITLLLVIFCATSRAKTDSLVGAIAPFQLISPSEYKAILELNNGNPFVTQNRLINSGSQVVTSIINNIVNGLINPVNLTGLDPIYSSLFKPGLGDKTQGYPLCTIQSNRNAQHSQRSYDAIVDPSSNYGSFSINFYPPGASVHIDNYDEDISIDEEESDYQKPSNQEVPLVQNIRPTTEPTQSGTNKDKPDNLVAPIVNCVVILKQPSTTTTSASTPTQRPSHRPLMRPSFYPQYQTIIPANNPRDPHYPISPYQVVSTPYPPFLGLISPSGPSNTPNGGWPNWPGSQVFTSSAPAGSANPPTWPYWASVAASAMASQGNKNSPSAPLGWPYLATHVPTTPTSSYMPSTFWTAINLNAGIPPSTPNIQILPNLPSAWFRPPTINLNQLMQQQHYNGNANEGRTAAHSEIAPEVQQEDVIGDVVGAIQTSQKKQSERILENQFKILPRL